MKSFNFVLLLILFLLTFKAQASKICYFSLNNTKEFVEMEKFTKNLNKYSKVPIEVVEYVTKDSNAEESFQKMVDSGEKCDGLVISGHHTGSFGGANASSNLNIDFMEKLSCDPNNKIFFNHIKALWLQGCRTLGVGKIEAYDTADFHTERVGAALEEDHLTQSFAQLNMEFSATLDQDNPLSSRYLRVFPRATTFGWTKTAPGQKAHSEFSIPYHIANIASLNDDRGKYFDNPVSDTLSSVSAMRYLEAINKTLGKNPKTGCDENRDEALLLEAWKRHGNVNKGYKYAYDNPDLNAYGSLFSSDNEFLKTAKEYECNLKRSLNSKDYLSTVDEILKNESLIGYSFNSIYELLQRLKKEGKIKDLEELRKKLQKSELLNLFLMKKMASQELGTLRKIDYYAFWKEMTGQTNDSIEKSILTAYVEIILKPTPTNNGQYTAVDFKRTMTQSLTKHGLINQEALFEIVKSSKASSAALDTVSWAIINSPSPIVGASEILQLIVKSDKANSSSFSYVLEAIYYSKTPISGVSEILQLIVKSDKADSYSLSTIADIIARSKMPISGASEILQLIVKSDKANWSSLHAVANAIGSAKTPINGASEMLQLIVKSDKAESNCFASVANAIGSAKTPINGASEMLRMIVKSDKANSNSFSFVASAIGNSKTPIEGATEILQLIVKSNKADSDSLDFVASAIHKSKAPIDGKDELLKQIESRLKNKTLAP